MISVSLNSSSQSHKSHTITPLSILLIKQTHLFKFSYDFTGFSCTICKKIFLIYLIIVTIMVFIKPATAGPLYSLETSSPSHLFSVITDSKRTKSEPSTFTIKSSFEEPFDNSNPSSESKGKRGLKYDDIETDRKLSFSIATTSSHWQKSLPQNQSGSLDQFSHFDNKSNVNNSAFLEQSRNAFLQLESTPLVKAPLLPEEERRQIWLERHRHKKLKLDKKTSFSEKNEQLSSQKHFLGLSSADFMNTNHSCKGDLFKHKVRMAGCEPKIIINRFCHGSCASFFIPKLQTKKLKASFQSCAACVPTETDLIQIKLDCPGRPEKEIYRTVMRVKRCACKNIQIDDDDDIDEGY